MSCLPGSAVDQNHQQRARLTFGNHSVLESFTKSNNWGLHAVLAVDRLERGLQSAAWTQLNVREAFGKANSDDVDLCLQPNEATREEGKKTAFFFTFANSFW
jgi:hypothetical protein